MATWSEGCGKVRKRQKGDISTDNWSLATETEREGDEEWGVSTLSPPQVSPLNVTPSSNPSPDNGKYVFELLF